MKNTFKFKLQKLILIITIFSIALHCAAQDNHKPVKMQRSSTSMERIAENKNETENIAVHNSLKAIMSQVEIECYLIDGILTGTDALKFDFHIHNKSTASIEIKNPAFQLEYVLSEATVKGEIINGTYHLSPSKDILIYSPLGAGAGKYNGTRMELIQRIPTLTININDQDFGETQEHLTLSAKETMTMKVSLSKALTDEVGEFVPFSYLPGRYRLYVSIRIVSFADPHLVVYGTFGNSVEIPRM